MSVALSQSFTINVININEQPTDIILSNNNVDENVSIGTIVGTLSSIDQDSGDTFTYTLSGIDASSFTIDGSNLKTNIILNYEVKNSYDITVTTSDGEFTYNKDFTINVNNINEVSTNITLFHPTVSIPSWPPSLYPHGNTNNINENVAINSIVGVLYTHDADSLYNPDETYRTYTHSNGPVSRIDNLGFWGWVHEVSNTVPDDNNGLDGYTSGDINTAYSTIDLQQETMVFGVVTQGIRWANTRCTSYRIRVSNDNITYSDVIIPLVQYDTVNNNNKFIGNTDTGSKVESYFNQPVTARYVRIYPTEFWQNTTYAPRHGMRYAILLSNTSYSYTLSGTDASSFILDGDTLKTNTVIDYETKNIYNFTITTSDGELTYSKDFTFNVNDINEAPTDITLSNNIVDENVSIGTIVGTLSSVDQDSGDTFTYTLTGTDASSFTIDGSNLKTNIILNYEVKNSYDITVTTSDGEFTYNKDFTINVNNINVAPIDISLFHPTTSMPWHQKYNFDHQNPYNIDEGRSINSIVGVLYTHDDDLLYNPDETYRTSSQGSDSLPYCYIDNEAWYGWHMGTFDSEGQRIYLADNNGLDGYTSGDINTAYSTIDLQQETMVYGIITQGVIWTYSYCTSYRIRVSNDDISYSDVIVPLVQYDTVNNNNKFIGNTDTGSKVESYFNQPVTARYVRIYPVLFASQINTIRHVMRYAILLSNTKNSIFSYTLSGTDASSFILDGDTLKTNTVIDYETKNIYNFTITTSDGELTYSKDFTFNVNRLATPTDITLSNTSIDENNSIGTVIGDVNIVTVASNNRFSYEISGIDASSFRIISSKLETYTIFDYETKNSYDITITVIPPSDSDLTNYLSPLYELAFSKDFTINVNNINEVPTDITLSNTSVDENVSIGTIVGTLSSSDPDVGNSFTYTLTGTDASSFTIDGSNLKTNIILNYEVKNSYDITVTTSDGEFTYNKDFTINVNDINEGPTDITLSTNIVDENVSIGTIVGTLSSVDEDSGDTFTYTLTGTDASSFLIDGSNLKTNIILNYEVKNSYDITITTSDGELTFSKDFTISINNINEAPKNITLFHPTASMPTTTGIYSVDENVAINSIVGVLYTHDDDSLYNPGENYRSYTPTPSGGAARQSRIDLVQHWGWGNGNTTQDDNNGLDGYTSGNIDTCYSTIDLQQETMVFGIVTTGRKNHSIWVRSYRIRVSNDNITYSDVIVPLLQYDTVNNNNKFIGNTDKNSKVESYFNQPVTARYVRIYPVDSNVGYGSSMRYAILLSNTSYSYTLSGTDASSFILDGDTLKTNTTINYETKNSYDITITTSDGELNYSKDFTINVNNINVAPTDITLFHPTNFMPTSTGIYSVNENVSINSIVGVLYTHDDDSLYNLGDSYRTYTHRNNTHITSSNIDAFHFWGWVHDDIYTVPDDNNGLDGYTSGDINTAYSTIDLQQETMVFGVVTQGRAWTDARCKSYRIRVSNDDISYSDVIVPLVQYDTVNNNNKFIGNTDTGSKVESYFNQPVTARYVRIYPTEFGNSSIHAPGHGMRYAILLSNTSYSYTLSGTDASSFILDGDTLKTNTTINYETKNSYDITITTSDGELNYSKDFTINVNNINEAPTDITLSNSSIDENISIGTEIGTLSTSDDDSGNTFTYTLSGDDSSYFTINGNKLLLNNNIKTNISFVKNNDTYATTQNPWYGYDHSGRGWLSNSYYVNYLWNNGRGKNQWSGSYYMHFPRNGNVNDKDLIDINLLTNGVKVLVKFNGKIYSRTIAGAWTKQIIKSGTVRFSGYLDVITVRADYMFTTGWSDGIFPWGDNSSRANQSYWENLSPNNNIYEFMLLQTDDVNYNYDFDERLIDQQNNIDVLIKSNFNINIAVNDGLNNYNKDFTITVNDIQNSQPTDITLSNNNIVENSAISTYIGSITTQDETSSSFTYTLGGTDASSFEILGSTYLRNLEVFDYETKNSYDITITTSDGELNYSKDFTINVNNINEAPTDITLSNNIVDENVSIGTIVGTLSSSDPDVSNSFTYTLSGTDASSFTIDGSNLKTNIILNYEVKNSYDITITTSDGELTFSKDFTINVNNINVAPMNITLFHPMNFMPSTSGLYSVNENVSINSIVGVLYTHDDDSLYNLGDSYRTYTHRDNTTISSSRIDAFHFWGWVHEVSNTVPDDNNGLDGYTSGNINTAYSTIDLQQETMVFGVVTQGLRWVDARCNSYRIRVSNDNITYSDVIIPLVQYDTVNNNNKFIANTDSGSKVESYFNQPVTARYVRIYPTEFAISMTWAGGTGYHQKHAMRYAILLSNTSYSYTLSGTDASSFILDGDTLKTNTVIDYETKNSYDITITTSDGELTYSKNFTINITDDIADNNTAPTNISLSSTSINENSSSGTTIGTVSSSDAQGDSITYTLGGTDSSSFTLTGTTLKSAAIFDYETKSSYSITITASDGELSSSSNFTISVINIDESPTISLNSIGNGSLTLNKSSGVNGTYNYSVNSNKSLTGTVSVSSTFTISGLTNGTTCYITIWKNGGTEYSNTVTVSLVTPSISFSSWNNSTAATSFSFSITPSSPILPSGFSYSYKVYKTTGGSEEEINTFSPGTLTFTRDQLLPSIQYTMTVKPVITVNGSGTLTGNNATVSKEIPYINKIRVIIMYNTAYSGSGSTQFNFVMGITNGEGTDIDNRNYHNRNADRGILSKAGSTNTVGNSKSNNTITTDIPITKSSNFRFTHLYINPTDGGNLQTSANSSESKVGFRIYIGRYVWFSDGTNRSTWGGSTSNTTHVSSGGPIAFAGRTWTSSLSLNTSYANTGSNTYSNFSSSSGWGHRQIAMTNGAKNYFHFWGGDYVVFSG